MELVTPFTECPLYMAFYINEVVGLAYISVSEMPKVDIFQWIIRDNRLSDTNQPDKSEAKTNKLGLLVINEQAFEFIW